MYIICEKKYIKFFTCPLCGGDLEVEWEGTCEEPFAFSRCTCCDATGARYSINFFGVNEAERLALTYWDSDDWYRSEVLGEFDENDVCYCEGDEEYVR